MTTTMMMVSYFLPIFAFEWLCQAVIEGSLSDSFTDDDDEEEEEEDDDE